MKKLGKEQRKRGLIKIEREMQSLWRQNFQNNRWFGFVQARPQDGIVAKSRGKKGGGKIDYYFTFGIAMVTLVVGLFFGYSFSDGVPDVISLTEEQERQARLDEARGCTRLLVEKNNEIDELQDGFKVCLNETLRKIR